MEKIRFKLTKHMLVKAWKVTNAYLALFSLVAMGFPLNKILIVTSYLGLAISFNLGWAMQYFIIKKDEGLK